MKEADVVELLKLLLKDVKGIKVIGTFKECDMQTLNKGLVVKINKEKFELMIDKVMQSE